MQVGVAPWVRVAILVGGCIALAAISKNINGLYLPKSSEEAIVFQNALLLLVLGSALLEKYYTKPADALVNSLMGFLTLLSVYKIAPVWPWKIVAGYCAVVFILSTTCVAVSSGKEMSPIRKRIAAWTYQPATVLGRSRVLHSIVFMAGLWFFYEIQHPLTISLLIFWGIFMVLWPLKIPELITKLFQRQHMKADARGLLTRIDDPNIVRVFLDGTAKWIRDKPWICHLPDKQWKWVVPLYSQYKEGQLLGTGIITSLEAVEIKGSKVNNLYELDDESIPEKSSINNCLGGDAHSNLVGIVVEGSEIGEINVEVLSQEAFEEGVLLWVKIGDERIYYQVVGGVTREESFERDLHGNQIATATQLGRLVPEKGFEKYEWLPAMNTPVFTYGEEETIQVDAVQKNDFVLGNIPKSTILVGGDFSKYYNYHTALLGVTGSGKTELAFDLIRHALNNDIKVVCIDITDQYGDRMSDLNPVDLSIPGNTAEKISEKLFEIETGKYGAPDEKKAFESFSSVVRDSVVKEIKDFLGDPNASNLGIINLREISNTKATLWITELYMTCLLKYAKEHMADNPKVLIVVEEAHTVMPEANTMGLGDFDSKGLVGKIAQIALQGRKYGVGLLVLAQRTATVSKTVLTQCNNIISFTCYDDTSLGFLRNIYSSEHVKLLPNLPRLHAVAFGNWIRSGRAIVFEVPYKAQKDNEGCRGAGHPC